MPLAEGGAALAEGGVYPVSPTPARLLRREEAENLVACSKVRSKVSKASRLECLYLVARGCCGERRAEDLVVCSEVSSIVSKALRRREEDQGPGSM